MKKRILLKAPILTQSGYGEHSRFVFRALKEREDLFDIYIEPLEWGKTGWIWEDSEERKDIDLCIGKFLHLMQSQEQNAFQICVYVDLPSAWKRLAPLTIGVTAGIETDSISPSWLNPCFTEVDKIIVPSEFSKQGFLNALDKYKDIFGEQVKNNLSQFKNQLDSKISVIGFPIKEYNLTDLNLNFETDFNFLLVAQWGPRKDIEGTIRNFLQEFKNNSDVGLVIKTNIVRNSVPDRYHTKKRIQAIKNEVPEAKCKIYLLHGELTNDEIHSLYNNDKIKAMINFGHGEGFGLPLFEAAYCGVPVITHDFGGQKDFLYANVNGKKKSLFTKIPYEVRPIQSDAVWVGVTEPDSEWAYIKPIAAKSSMRECYKDHGRFKGQAKKLKEYLLSKDKNESYTKIVSALAEDVLGNGN